MTGAPVGDGFGEHVFYRKLTDVRELAAGALAVDRRHRNRCSRSSRLVASGDINQDLGVSGGATTRIGPATVAVRTQCSHWWRKASPMDA